MTAWFSVNIRTRFCSLLRDETVYTVYGLFTYQTDCSEAQRTDGGAVVWITPCLIVTAFAARRLDVTSLTWRGVRLIYQTALILWP